MRGLFRWATFVLAFAWLLHGAGDVAAQKVYKWTDKDGKVHFSNVGPGGEGATDQSSSVLVQLYFGVDVPTGSTVTAPVGAPKPELQNIWLGGLRVVFDWRHYFRY